MAERLAPLSSGVHFAHEGTGAFAKALAPVEFDSADAWVWLAYDQLNTVFLESLNLDGKVGVLLIESSDKALSLIHI